MLIQWCEFGGRTVQWQYCPLCPLFLQFCLVTLVLRILHTSALILVLDDANQSWALQQYAALSKLSYLIWCASKPWEPALWIIPSGRVINFHQWTYHYMQWHCSTTLVFDISFGWVFQEETLDLCTRNQFRPPDDDRQMRLNKAHLLKLLLTSCLFLPHLSGSLFSIIDLFFLFR